MKILFLILIFNSTVASAAGEARFQLYTFPQFVNRSILLDTQTGKMWTDKCLKQADDGSCKSSAWTMDKVEGVTMTSKELNDYQEYLDMTPEEQAKYLKGKK